MLSMPPATTMSALPARMMSCASIVAFMPEPHIFDNVVQWVDSGRPPFSEAWRAGAWPCPAMRQLPKITSSTSRGGDAGARDRRLDRDTAQIRCRQRREVAKQTADGRPGGGDDDHGIVLHVRPSPRKWRQPRGAVCAPATASGAGLRLAHAPRAAHEFAGAVGAHAIERIGAGGAERAFVAADVRGVVVGGRAATHIAGSVRAFRVPCSTSRYLVSLNNSRPISIRRISDVPAPISYSLASRHSRPVANSLM